MEYNVLKTRDEVRVPRDAASYAATNYGERKMKKYVTLVFEYESNSDLAVIRELAGTKQCCAWSMDHELVRLDLMRQAAEDGDTKKTLEYSQADGVMPLLAELRTA